MLLTITSTSPPATDLGYLLYKNPARVQTFDLKFGKAHVFYPQATPEICTAALLLDIDPVHLVRGQHGTVEQYVNDRPYVASSFMSVAIAQVLGSALAGQCKDRPELAQTPIPLLAKLSVLQCRGGESVLRRLFEPLGYTLSVERYPLDETFPDWGLSEYFTVSLAVTARLSELLSHLYVLIPVLDAEKHYWVGDEEVEKLLRHGEGWLASHPEREMIARRYLKFQHLVRQALRQLADEDNTDPDATGEAHAQEEVALEQRISLQEQRMGVVMAVLKGADIRRVIDLGCGEGSLLQLLLADRTFTEIVGMDVSHRALEVASDRLHLDRLPPLQKERIRLIHGALTYRDQRLEGFDAATVVEVIEHLDLARLASFERVLFECAHPRLVVLTTPNVEYNVNFTSLPSGRLRHKDHRFEWTRVEFQDWAKRVAERFDYTVRYLPVGTEDPLLGSPTQMAVFSLNKPVPHVETPDSSN
jgi:3' terminal RNA ribose 2'-O-methyltransferase Hen1